MERQRTGNGVLPAELVLAALGYGSMACEVSTAMRLDGWDIVKWFKFTSQGKSTSSASSSFSIPT